ncbi:MAG: isoprenylcysteine carboxylmethyltransferase family protein [Alcanivoracaceae bacterium]|nr:isoprenylcysteine carboxylmethyltransferase family protein [Alcanivoracaceae bacterium]
MRIPPLLVVALMLLAMVPLAHVLPTTAMPDAARWGAVTFFGLVGAIFVLPAAISFRRAGTTVDPRNPEKTEALVTDGLYRISRNPMYVGFCFWLIAGAFAVSSLWLLIAWPMFVIYMNALQIPAEERAMAEKFAEQWSVFCERVPRWLV